jgi:hypothetical protein
MSESWSRESRSAKRIEYRGALLCALLLAPILCGAESTQGGQSASARLAFTVVIPPVFRVLEVKPVAGGLGYRIWTNVASVRIDGHEYRFGRVGEFTLTLPAAPAGRYIVHGL